MPLPLIPIIAGIAAFTGGAVIGGGAAAAVTVKTAPKLAAQIPVVPPVVKTVSMPVINTAKTVTEGAKLTAWIISNAKFLFLLWLIFAVWRAFK